MGWVTGWKERSEWALCMKRHNKKRCKMKGRNGEMGRRSEEVALFFVFDLRPRPAASNHWPSLCTLHPPTTTTTRSSSSCPCCCCSLARPPAPKKTRQDRHRQNSASDHPPHPHPPIHPNPHPQQQTPTMGNSWRRPESEPRLGKAELFLERARNLNPQTIEVRKRESSG